MRESPAWPLMTALITLFLLAGCGGGGSGGGGLSLGPGSGDNGDNPGEPDPASRAGETYRQAIEVPATGDTLIAQVFEPSTVTEGETYPLVLHSHGYGGSRNVTPSAFQQRLRDAGYYVVSFDQRGFGESSSTVRVQSPDFEGRSLITLLDWTEANLDQLAYRDDRMVVGSYGGSYGGMYQLLMAAADPEHRLRVIAPDITPHDLTYSLNAKDVIKSGWALALVAGGELPLIGLATGSAGPEALLDELLTLVGERQNLRQDQVIYETLLEGALTNEFPDAGRNLFVYHSFRYFCDGQSAGPQDGFRIGEPDPIGFAPDAPPPIDALLTQGFRDTLFNFNDGLDNYRCLRDLGGDVRYLTHQSGHILPVSLGTAGLEDPLDPFYQALTVPGFQDAGGPRTCGSLNLDEVQFAWFEAKLRGRDAALDAVLTTGDNVCLSLAEGDAISVDAVQVGSNNPIAFDTSVAQFNSALGILGTVLGSGPRELLSADVPLLTVPQSRILAGVPTLDMDVQPPADGLPLADCQVPLLPAACDPIYFLAIGKRAPGQQRWDIVDDQLTPVRGFGRHQLRMTGIAERLSAGEELGLLIYGFHPQYPVTWSRDLLVPAAEVSGTVALPLLSPTEVVREGV